MATRVNIGSQASCAGAASLTTNSPSATLGNTLVLQISWALSTGGAATPSAPAGWTASGLPLSSHNGTLGAAGYVLFYKTAAGGVESPVFTAPDSSSNLYANGIITEWSGMGAHDTNDASAIITDNVGGASTGTTVPNTGTLANPNSTVFTGIGFLSNVGLGNANFAFSGGSWNVEAVDNNTGVSVGTLIGDKGVTVNTALGAVYTWTTDSTILSFQAAVVVFSDASGAAATQPSDVGANRNRPGRGPFSKGAFRVSTPDVFANQIIVVSLTPTDFSIVGSNRNRPGRGPFSKGIFELSIVDAFTSAPVVVPPSVTDFSDIGSNRNRPGRGPFSMGRFFVGRMDAFTSGSQVYNVDITEVVSATDVVSSIATLPSSLTEVFSATEVLSSLAVFIAANSEAATATDVISGLIAAVAAITEAANAADVVSSALVGVAALSESVVATDALSSIAVFACSLTEAASAADSLSSTGAVYSLSITETPSLTDLLAASIQGASSLSEVMTATDAISALAALNGALAEAAAAIEALSTAGSFSISVVEAANAAAVIAIMSRGMPPGSRVFSVPVRDRVIIIQAQ